MIGNEDVFRFQEGYVLCLVVTTDNLTRADLEVTNDFLAPIPVPQGSRLPHECWYRNRSSKGVL